MREAVFSDWMIGLLQRGRNAHRHRALLIAVAFAFAGVPAVSPGAAARPIETEHETAPTSMVSLAAPCWAAGASGMRRHPAPVPRILSPLPRIVARAKPPDALTSPGLPEDFGLNGIGVPKLE
jgi:hypothetical protein